MIGGLYGVSLGRAFFGESMFHYERDASKLALFHLVEFARHHNFHFIDAQQPTGHLESLGAGKVPREQFLELLAKAMKEDSLAGSWTGIR
jgi:leucyl/phenylalanyl-tRNA--protein transferase